MLHFSIKPLLTGTALAAICIVAVAVAVAAIALLARGPISEMLGLSDPFDQIPFDPANWAQHYQQDRAPMARDLISNHLPNGMSSAEVATLLGPPGSVKPGILGGSTVRASSTYVYGIGSWSNVGFD